MSWTKNKPNPPPTGTKSDWYWYQDDTSKEPWAVEICPGSWKLYSYDGFWWTEPIQKPSSSAPNTDKKLTKKEEKPVKKVEPKLDRKVEFEQALLSLPEIVKTI